MMTLIRIFALSSLFAPMVVLAATPQDAAPAAAPQKKAVHARPGTSTDPGDRAFQANCARCHSAPEQIRPSISGTVILHMRVRANLNAKDEALLVKYLTQ